MEGRLVTERELRLKAIQDKAEGILARAAAEMRGLLPLLAKEVEVFPRFPGTPTPAIEVDPWPGERKEVGCVVLLPEGELKEMIISAFPLLDQRVFPMDDTRDLHLHPLDYLLFVYGAICQFSQRLGEESSPEETGS